VNPLKLWLLDADVVIKLLELSVFDKLAKLHQLHIASTVINEVKFYKKDNQKIQVNFRREYVESGRVIEVIASASEMQQVLLKLPPLKRDAIHPGEIESLSILVRDDTLTLCTFDAAAIRAVPFIDASDRVISAERLLQTSGLMLSPGHKLDPRLTEKYFQSNLSIGQQEFIYASKKNNK
jgi:hypothetical protein